MRVLVVDNERPTAVAPEANPVALESCQLVGA